MDRGSEFEKKFQSDFLKTMPKATIDRLYNNMSMYKGVANICDFIGYRKPNIYYLECKSVKKQYFPFSFRQYDKLLTKLGLEGVRVGVVVWYINYDKVVYLPIRTVKQMLADGIKSLNVLKLDDLKLKYRIIDIPSVKKRVYMDSDYSVLLNLEEGD